MHKSIPSYSAKTNLTTKIYKPRNNAKIKPNHQNFHAMNEETTDKTVLSPSRLQRLLQTFKQQHGKKYKLQALGYFGSYSRNTATPDSDVDILFDTDYPNLLLTSIMKQDLEELLKKPVDLLRFHEAMNPRLKARVEKEAIYV